jgi:hypothetical protein
MERRSDQKDKKVIQEFTLNNRTCVLPMLLAKGKITKETVAMLSSWRHSGFNVFLRQAQDGVCGKRISPKDDTAMENLARYIMRSRPPPKIHDPPVCTHNTERHSTPYIADEHCQPFPSDEVLCRDPDYSWDQYIQS